MSVKWLVLLLVAGVGFTPLQAVSHQDLSKALSEDVLMVSNYPETVMNPGLMLSTVMHQKSMRLMYHHLNASEKPLYVSVLLTNRSSIPAVVDVTTGLGGSSEDVVFAGHKAMWSFMNGLVSPSDNVVIAPHSSRSIVLHKIKPSQTASGFLRIARQNKALIGVKVKMVDQSYPHLTGFLDVSDVWDMYRIGVYDTGYERVEKTLEFGDDSATFRIGGKPYIQDVKTKDVLKGNYGKVYDFALTLVNLTTGVKQVRAFVTPLKKGGVDRGVFIVDGEVKEIGVLRYGERVVQSEEIFDLVLGPLERRVVELLSIPQAGCYYPIELSFKPDP